MERINLKINEPRPEDKERFNELVKGMNDAINQFTYAYGEEYETIQRCFDAYFKKEGIIIPASADEFLTWLAVKYPDEPIGNMVAEAKDPNNYKLFHEYQVRRVNNRGWDLDKELEYLEKGGEYKQDDCNLYEVNRMLVERIFDLCQNKVRKPIFNIDKTEFLERFERAYFYGNIYTKGSKTKIRTIVYGAYYFGAVNNDWYTDAVKSLGITKSQCSRKPKDDDLFDKLGKVIKIYNNIKPKLENIDNEYKMETNKELKRLDP